MGSPSSRRAKPAGLPGYSGTPLAKKLGIKAGSKVLIVDAPKHYLRLLAPLPAGVTFARRIGADVEIAQVFTTKADSLIRHLRSLRDTLDHDAAIWVSWPKKASGVATEVTEDTIRRIALPLGLVDIKVCAVTAVWSGLKLVVRKELR